MVSKICDLPEGYVPSDSEEFMNDFQREYFRRKLEKGAENDALCWCNPPMK